jgi:8-amino-7-oxononanoate synthase
MSDIDAVLAAELDAVRTRSLYRVRRVMAGRTGVVQVLDGRKLTSFCSNDYLGLAGHPDVAASLAASAVELGVGAGAAHLVNGHSRSHHALEEELADLVGRPRALLFSTGYMANLGVGAALVARGDAVFEDRLNHASLLDAGLLSGARFSRYAHADAGALDARLARADSARRKLVFTDGVFSMDGDMAPLPALAETCARHGGWLVVDDAHGLGVIGPDGRGSVTASGLGMDEVPVLVGTLGKAFGTFGAFVAGSEAVIEMLIQRARTYIYTTALPPALAEATRTAVRLARGDQGRREKLHSLIARFRAGAAGLGLPLTASATPIQPLIVGEADAAMKLSEDLLAKDLLVTAIRPPTVPEGTARLRVTLSAAHTEAQVDRLLEALDECWPEAGR